MNIEKISKITLWALMGISAIIFILFFVVNFDIKWEENPKMNNPQFTDVLINHPWSDIRNRAGAEQLLRPTEEQPHSVVHRQLQEEIRTGEGGTGSTAKGRETEGGGIPPATQRPRGPVRQRPEEPRQLHRPVRPHRPERGVRRGAAHPQDGGARENRRGSKGL